MWVLRSKPGSSARATSILTIEPSLQPTFWPRLEWLDLVYLNHDSNIGKTIGRFCQYLLLAIFSTPVYMMINERANLLYLSRGFCFHVNQVVLKLDAHEKILDSVLQGNIYLLISILWIQKFNSSILMSLIFLLVYPQDSPEIWPLYIYFISHLYQFNNHRSSRKD